MKLNLQLLSKSQNQTARHVVQSELKTNSGQSQRLSGAETPPPVLGISFLGQRSRAKGATEKLENLLQELESFAIYDCEQGGFIATKWRGTSSKHPGTKLGWAKNINAGHLYITFAGKTYAIHNLVWLWHTGSWPTAEIDHIDQNETNNKIENLRSAGAALNKRNNRMYSNNTTGYTGVYYHKRTGKYESAVRVDTKYISFGAFNTPEEANAARNRAIALHPEWGFTEQHGKTPSRPKDVRPNKPTLRITLKSK